MKSLTVSFYYLPLFKYSIALGLASVRAEEIESMFDYSSIGTRPLSSWPSLAKFSFFKIVES